MQLHVRRRHIFQVWKPSVIAHAHWEPRRFCFSLFLSLIFWFLGTLGSHYWIACNTKWWIIPCLKCISGILPISYAFIWSLFWGWRFWWHVLLLKLLLDLFECDWLCLIQRRFLSWWVNGWEYHIILEIRLMNRYALKWILIFSFWGLTYFATRMYWPIRWGI